MKPAVVAALLATSLVVAQPVDDLEFDKRALVQHANHYRRAHGHDHGHGHVHRRDLVVEWVTETEIVTKYIDATTTVWSTSSYLSAITTSATSTISAADQVFRESLPPVDSATLAAPTPSPSPLIQPVVAPSSTPSPPPPPPVVVAPTPAPSPTPPAAPIVPALPPPPAAVPAPVPAPSPTPVPAPPPVPTPVVAPVAAPIVAQAVAAPASQTYTGDLTYYTIGMGACGVDDTGKDNEIAIVALSYLLMGPESNNNPYCGRTITIQGPDGKTATAIVEDKCMGCAYDSIDVSQMAFLEIFDSLGVGRAQVEWWFN